ncbi:MAG: hypothetical protein ACE5L6_06140 [Candidatus Bathyarchaeia archaeon]
MRPNIRGFERKAPRKEFDRVAREVLYSLAIQLRDLLKDDNTINVFNVYFILNDALQQLFQRSIAVTDSPRLVRKTNNACTHFEALKNLSENAPIPNECSICPRLVHCFSRRTEA